MLDPTDLHNTRFSLRASDKDLELLVNNNRVSMKSIKSVWIRRPFNRDASTTLEKHIQAELKTFTEGLIGIFVAHGMFVLNNPLTANFVANKVVQWDTFRSIGIPAPATRFSNMPRDIKPEYTVSKQFIKKSFHIGSSVFLLPTKVISKQEKAALKGQRFPPLILQDRIDMDYEVRVTVVGRKIFAAKVEYDTRNTHDYRLLFNQTGKLTYKKYRLPVASEQDCLRILEHFDLHFGCLDIAVDKAGKHWILELNPNGQWRWIEEETGIPIAREIANLLIHPRQ